MSALAKRYLRSRIVAPLVVLIAVLCVAWRGEAQRADSTRQAWDYKFVWIDIDISISDRGKSRWFEDGQKELPQPVQMPLKAKELGTLGWELVDVTSMNGSENVMSLGFRVSTNAIQYVFKRRK